MVLVFMLPCGCMDLLEFSLRVYAYRGLSDRYDLGWDDDAILAMVDRVDGDRYEGSLQEQSVEELWMLTRSTYSEYKNAFLVGHRETVLVDEYTLAEYIERLEYELTVIREMGFNTYFLIVQDFIVRAKRNAIMVGPGRGSGAGSLLAYCLLITDVDPLPYGLLFERFLNPARVSMPDFDVDFEDTLRDKVIEYVIEHYGSNKVAAIGTYMQMTTKAAFKDAARAVGMPFDKANTVSNVIQADSFDEIMSHPNQHEEFLIHYNNDNIVKRAVDFAIILERNLRQVGVHACGILITPDPVTTYTSIQPIDKKHQDPESTNLSMAVTQNDGKMLEDVGLLKMDFLGLRNLSIIKNCIKIIRARHQKEGKDLPDIFSKYFEMMSFDPPLDDAYTYEQVFQSGDTTGIFQFEGSGMRRFLVQLEASDINDLVAMSALYRPGPMEFIPRYIARKHGEEEVAYMTDDLRSTLDRGHDDAIVESEKNKLREDLDPILGLTYGIPVYQEQLMFLVQAMAGFSLAEADNLRRGVGKKIKSVIDKIKPQFIAGCASHRGYTPETALWVFEKMIEPAASYSFNKSHSVCYSLIAYQTGYLKAHYPIEFYAALLRSHENNTDRLSLLIDETRAHGIQVAVPDVNNAFPHVSAIDTIIYLGFLAIKGVGYDVADMIERERVNNGLYTSLEDFLRRCMNVINKKSLEGLIKSGALDTFGVSRTTMLDHIEFVLRRTKDSQASEGGLFGGMDVVSQINRPSEPEDTLVKQMNLEHQVFNNFVSVHPFDGMYSVLKKFTFISQAQDNEQFGQYVICGYIAGIQRARKKGFFVKVVDISGEVEFFMVDKMNLKLLDVVQVHGYKANRWSVDKIVVVDIQAWRDKVRASGKYDPEMTVARVQKERKKKRKEDDIKNKADAESRERMMAQLRQETDLMKTTENVVGDINEIVVTDDEGVGEMGADDANTAADSHSSTASSAGVPTRPLPDTVDDIVRVTTLLKQPVGDCAVVVGGTQYHVTKDVYNQLFALLSPSG